MRSGSLRHLMQQQVPTLSANAGGDRVPVFANSGVPVWASIEPLSGREFIEARQVSSDVTHRVRMRYASASAVDPTYQLTFDSRKFSIVSVMNIGERNRELEIMCKEVV